MKLGHKKIEKVKALIIKDGKGILGEEDVEDLKNCTDLCDIVSWLDSCGFGDYVKCYSYILDLVVKKYVK